MEESCTNCIYLNRSKVRLDKSDNTYDYGCMKGRTGYTFHNMRKDEELEKRGCSDFRDRRSLVLVPGDCVQFQKFRVKVRYMYCGRVQGKRLLYGGKIVNGTVNSCRFILVPDDFCRIIKRDKESCIFMFEKKYAEKRKDEFMRMEGLRR